jgi:hypothetical protein
MWFFALRFFGIFFFLDKNATVRGGYIFDREEVSFRKTGRFPFWNIQILLRIVYSVCSILLATLRTLITSTSTSSTIIIF